MTHFVKYFIVGIICAALFEMISEKNNPIKSQPLFILIGILIYYIFDSNIHYFKSLLSESFDISLNNLTVSDLITAQAKASNKKLQTIQQAQAEIDIQTKAKTFQKAQADAQTLALAAAKANVDAVAAEYLKQQKDAVTSKQNELEQSKLALIKKQIELMNLQNIVTEEDLTGKTMATLGKNINDQIIDNMKLLAGGGITQVAKPAQVIAKPIAQVIAKPVAQVVAKSDKECECESKLEEVIKKFFSKKKYIDDNGIIQNIIEGDMKYNQLDLSLLQPLGSNDDTLTNKWNHGYTILNTDKWAVPSRQLPEAKTNKYNYVSPITTSGYPLNVLDFDDSRRILGPDTINEEYIKEKLNQD